MWRVAESREGHSRGKKVAAMAMICSFVGLLSLQSVTGTLTRFAIVELCFLQVEFSGGLETCLWVDNHVERETIAKRAFQMSQGSICSISKLPPSLNGNMLSALGTTRGLCATNVLVFNINYRHTPEFVFPTAWLDVQDAFIWAHANMDTLGGNREQIIVGGISAGAQLTASLVLEQHLGLAVPDLPAIKGQVLMIPCVAHIDHYDLLLQQLKDPSLSSYKQNVDAPILSVKTVHMFTGLLLAGTPGVQANDTKINIGNATKDQVQGLPPAAFGIAGLDPLRDEGLLYAKLLTESE